MTPMQMAMLRDFRKRHIRYLVIGGQAIRSFGIDRVTNDLDLWVARDIANASALHQYLHRQPNIPSIERLQEPNIKLTIGAPIHSEVDILTSVAGDPLFDSCFNRSIRHVLDGVRLPIISAEDLLNIKTTSSELMESEAEDLSLTEEDRQQARGTARRDRRDIMLLEMYIATQN